MSTMLSHTPRARNTVPGITSAGAPLRIGAVALTVRDLEEMSRFYRQVIGLTSIEREAGIERLGVGETILLELRHDPSAPLADRRAAGLFHLAFLLPSRADLGQWLRQTAEQRIGLQGASDHGEARRSMSVIPRATESRCIPTAPRPTGPGTMVR